MWTWILKTLLSLFLEDIFFKKYLKPLISLLSGNFGIFTLKVLFITKPIRICCCSVTKLCLTLCDPMDGSTPGLPVPHHLQSSPTFMSIELVMPSNNLFHCCPLLPSIFPGILIIFSNESALFIRWPKYWSFSFSTSLSNEYSELISFSIDWFDLLTVQGTPRIYFMKHFQKLSYV